MIQKIGNNQFGFTLIESMIALFVFTFCILSLSYLQLFSIKGNATAMGLSESVQEACSGLDILESLSYSNSTPLSESDDKTFGTHYGTTLQLTGVLTYDVTNENNVKSLFSLSESFPGVDAKVIQVKSSRVVGGIPKSITLDYIKIDY